MASDISSPTSKVIQLPSADGVLKRPNLNGFVNIVSKVIKDNTEPPYIRARREAEEADKTYRTAIRQLDRQRLGLEERIEDTLKLLQKFELERLRAVKSGKFCVGNVYVYILT